MGEDRTLEFIRQTNKDGTLHSYCSKCLVAVVDSTSLAEVENAELEHECSPQVLALIEKYSEVS